jgi:hypothetical protein
VQDAATAVTAAAAHERRKSDHLRLSSGHFQAPGASTLLARHLKKGASQPSANAGREKDSEDYRLSTTQTTL